MVMFAVARLIYFADLELRRDIGEVWNIALQLRPVRQHSLLEVADRVEVQFPMHE